MFDKIQLWLTTAFILFFEFVLWDTGEHARHVVVLMTATLLALAVRWTLQAVHWVLAFGLTVKRRGWPPSSSRVMRSIR